MNSYARICRNAFRRGLSAIVAFSMMISVCIISGISISVRAANERDVYLDVSQNSDMKSKRYLSAEFTNSDGDTVNANLSYVQGGSYVYSAKVSGSGNATVYARNYPANLLSFKENGKNLIIVPKSFGKGYLYAWNYANDNNQKWPGQKMNENGDYYYLNIDEKFTSCIFSNNGGNQTDNLSLEGKLENGVAYYNGAHFESSYKATVDLNELSQSNSQAFIDRNGNVQYSNYPYGYKASSSSTGTKTVYLYNSNWDNAYIVYDYNDPYRVTEQMVKTNGRYFEAKVPDGAAFVFKPQENSNNGATAALKYPSNITDSAAYIMENGNGRWGQLEDIPEEQENRVKHDFPDNIYAVKATYFDYLTNEEIKDGYITGFSDAGAWYPFDAFNDKISELASQNSTWTYPLYFGNFYNNGSDDYKNQSSRKSFVAAANNSNNIGGSNRAVPGLVLGKLNSSGNLMATKDLQMPYFDKSFLKNTVSVGGKTSELAKVFDSYFPFRYTEENGVTTYRFNSDIVDNVYFDNPQNPRKVSYGAGEDYAISDYGHLFSSTQGHGIFPFNKKGDNNCLDFGFGIRLDIDFRVPKDGLLPGAVKVPADEIWIKTNYNSCNVYLFTEGQNGSSQITLQKNEYGYFVFNTKNVNYENFILKKNANDWTDQYPKNGGTNILIKDYKGSIWNYSGDGITNIDNSVKFDYSGDDDLWIFITDPETNASELVLDLGGCHKKAEGTIDFHTMKATSKQVYNIKADDKNNIPQGPQDNAVKTFNGGENLDPNKIYHMTVFYMERGLIESNFEVSFTMTPAGNNLKVTNKLDTADITDDIAQDIKDNMSFNYSASDTTAGQSKSFALSDGGLQEYDNAFKTGNQMNVVQTGANSLENLSYTTSWQRVNNTTGDVEAASTSGGSTSFKFENSKNPNEYAKYQVDYMNRLQTTSLNVSKAVENEDGDKYETAKKFPFALSLDIAGGSNYKPYRFEYKLNGGDTVYRTGADGSFMLGADETVEIINLPVGATYKLTEGSVAGFKPLNNVYEHTGTTGVNNNVSVTNIVQVSTKPVKVTKTLDGSRYTGEKFIYSLEGLSPMVIGNDGGEEVYSKNTVHTPVNSLSVKNIQNGEVVFSDSDFIVLTEPGSYRYKVTESLANENDKLYYEMDSKAIFVEIIVDERGDVQDPTYYAVENGANLESKLNEVFTAENAVTNPVFENKTKKGSVTIEKTDQSDKPVGGAEFTIYKVKNEGDTSFTEGNRVKYGETSEADGKVTFDNLPLLGENGKPQVYAVRETKAPKDYAVNKTVKYFTLPYEENGNYHYSITFTYVDGIVIMPDASGSGMNIYLVTGAMLAGIALLLFGAYTIYDMHERKKRRSRFIH